MNIRKIIREETNFASEKKGVGWLENIQYHLYVLEKIQKGQKSIKDGNGISNEEVTKYVPMG